MEARRPENLNGRKGPARWTVAGVAFLCGLLSFLVYIPVLGNGFINWDDPKYVYDNPLIRSMDAEFFKAVFTRPYFNNWHPLTMLSYAVDYRFWGLDPTGYHLTNNIFHALNTALVFILAVRLIRASGAGGSSRGMIFVGVFSALFFGLHPVHVESVAWVSERKDVLSAFFFILSVLAYLKYAEGTLKRWWAATLLFFSLALMSKPMAVTLPFVLLILDFYPLRRAGGVKKAVVEKLPFFALSAVSGAVTLLSQQEAFAKEGILTAGARVATAIRAPGFYLYKMVLPLDLAPYYPHPVSIDFFTAEYIGSAVFLAALTIFCLLIVKKERVFLSGWLYYLVTLLPVLGLLQVGGQAAADRYTYIPSIGVAVLFGVGVTTLIGRLPQKAFTPAGAALIVILASALSYGTVRQVPVWKDSETLWTYEIEKFPEAHLPYNNRGLVRQDRGDLKGAIEDFSKAVSLAPELAELHNNRGVALYLTGDFASALRDYNAAITLDPAYRGYHYNRGLSFQRLGNMASAIEDYTAELKIDPVNTEAYLHRGLAFRDIGRPDLAVEDLSKALSISPEDKAALYYIGVSYASIGRRAEAVESLKKARGLGLSEATEVLRQLGEE